MPTTTQYKDLTGEDLHVNKVYPETNTEFSTNSLAVLEARYLAADTSLLWCGPSVPGYFRDFIDTE